MTFQDIVSLYNIRPEHVDALQAWVIELAVNNKRKPGRPQVVNKEKAKDAAPSIDSGICTVSVSSPDGKFWNSPDGVAYVKFSCESFEATEAMTTVEFLDLFFNGVEVDKASGKVDVRNISVRFSQVCEGIDMMRCFADFNFLLNLNYRVIIKRKVPTFSCKAEVKSVEVVGLRSDFATMGNANGDFRI